MFDSFPTMWSNRTPKEAYYEPLSSTSDSEPSPSPFLPERTSASTLKTSSSSKRSTMVMLSLLLLLGCLTYLSFSQATPAAAVAEGCPDYSSYSATPHAPLSNGSLQLPSMRPPPACRTFNSSRVEEIITTLTPRFKDPDLAMLFSNAFPNTLDTTIKWQNEELAFIVTGDIDAEWLRDTFNQINVYAELIGTDTTLQSLVKKIIKLQARYISQYPFCNSFQAPSESGIAPVFNSAAVGAKVEPSYDNTTVFECKFEIDSLAGFMALSSRYHEKTNDSSFVTTGSNSWTNAMEQILTTLEAETRSTLDEAGYIQSAYNFSSNLDVVINGGVGPPQLFTGLVGTSFRPADDKVVFRFNIADNAMVVVELAKLAPLLRAKSPDLASRALKLSDSVRAAIEKHGVINHPRFGNVYAFEVDGYGSYQMMDDANVPSLLSLPFLGYTNITSEPYAATRKMILSASGNPYYNVGSGGGAIGSPHTGIQNVWPMSLVTQILTTDDDAEILRCLSTILNNTAGLGLIHESFNVHDSKRYSRQWFAWANSYFAQMILDLADRKPGLIFKDATRFLAGGK